ncbi:heparinase II/III-family protein [Alteromonas sp. ASW11-36]|uniref:Heparinase II/III-family protein n=1 Tax=Alteromonas arenosi TaxID=3055817 RepID=A0ABT7T0N0_9ALTE|nr:heparinase II/III-family protein [Alteromonas sp. ASW11-36]MDM7861978.1 heparinase II/III-family protein [Alteromonas sp. ASW11-36]
MNKRLFWYFNRLKKMTLMEVIYRAFSFISLSLHVAKNKKFVDYNVDSSELDLVRLNVLVTHVESMEFKLTESNERLLKANKLALYGEEIDLSIPEAWNICPKTRFKWPLIPYQKIDYRAEGRDIRVVWEASRFQHFLPLSLCCHDVAEVKSTIGLQLDSWKLSNTMFIGPHYVSSMECGHRIISLLYTLAILDSRFGLDKFNDLVVVALQIIKSHSDYIKRHLSLFSSSGNHTLVESLSLFMSESLLLKNTNLKRRDKYANLFSKEFLRQTREDGSGIEETSWYLMFIHDLASTFCVLNDNVQVQLRLQQVAIFLSHLLNSSDELIGYGDSDDGFALSAYFRSLKPLKSMNVTKVFPDSGVINCQFPRLKVWAFATELGMPPSYGHGHADALSIVFEADTKMIAIDKGTYSYNIDDKRRDYYRSTQAHNTVTIDCASQSSASGRFMWESNVRSDLLFEETASDYAFYVMKHNGYLSRFESIHYRGFFVNASNLIVFDFVKSELQNSAQLRWYFPSKDFTYISKESAVIGGVTAKLHGGIEESNNISPSQYDTEYSTRYLDLSECSLLSTNFLPNQLVISEFNLGQSYEYKNFEEKFIKLVMDDK